MNRRRFSNWSVWIGALVLASLLWFHAVTEQQFRRVVDIPLLFSESAATSDGEEIIIANQPPAHVQVVIGGRGKDLLRLGGDDLLLRLQTPRGRPGARVSYHLSIDQVETHTDLPVRVEEVVAPREVEVLLDRKVEREVPVRPVVDLQIANSYTQVGALRLDPRAVRITGPRREVERVRSIETDSVVLRDVREDVEREVALRPPANVRLELSQSTVVLGIDVQEVAEYTIANVSVAVRGAGGRELAAEPSRVAVRVRGGADVIYDIDPERDLQLFVDYQRWLREGEDPGQVQAVVDSLFEILEIIPPAVSIVPR
ncbi:MAG: YbbR-like domain-containing protein [Gemmatimonadota bacterium]